MEVIYTDHLKLILGLRKIPEEYPKIILENSEQLFFDVLEKRNIAIKRLKYGKVRRTLE